MFFGCSKPCPECNATGFIEETCPICKGTKTVKSKCPDCDGIGKVRDSCSVCEGKGQQICDYSKSHSSPALFSAYKYVAVCRKGRLEVLGDKCTASEKLKNTICPKCGGSGLIKCYNCGGTGLTSKLCKRCDGKGEAFIDCLNCNGEGKIKKTCPKCNGKGKV